MGARATHRTRPKTRRRLDKFPVKFPAKSVADARGSQISLFILNVQNSRIEYSIFSVFIDNSTKPHSFATRGVTRNCRKRTKRNAAVRPARPNENRGQRTRFRARIVRRRDAKSCAPRLVFAAFTEKTIPKTRCARSRGVAIGLIRTTGFSNADSRCGR